MKPYLILLLVVFGLWRTETAVAQETSSRRSQSSQPDSGEIPQRPNIVLFNLDDADVDLFTDQLLDDHFPNISKLAREGLSFTNCHVGTPLCGPSRTCMLRGQHAHRTGIKTNLPTGTMNNGFSGGYKLFETNGLASEHIGVWMQRAGYRTMFIGKYLHGRVNPEAIVGWDDMLICFGGNYFNVARYLKRIEDQYERRRVIDESIFRTTYEADEAVYMIQQQVALRSTSDDRQPFFLYIAPLAPHKPARNGKMLQKEYEDGGKEIRIPETPDLNETEIGDKPDFLQSVKLDEATISMLHEEHRKRAMSVKSVDDMVGKIMKCLTDQGIADETLIFFTSDHGYQLGHNRMIAKKLPYHRCTHVPMFVHGSGVRSGKSNELLVQIDLIPTFMELAEGQATVEQDGKSIVSLLSKSPEKESKPFRDALLIQNWEEKGQIGKYIPATYASLRLPNEIYTEWSNGDSEYYNLETDPYQVENTINEVPNEKLAAWASRLRELKKGGTAPVATISMPETISRNTTVSGFAEDDQAIDKVFVELKNPDTEQYWNGTTWQTEKASVEAKLARHGGLVSNWSTPVDLGIFKEGSDLLVVATSADKEGNVSKPATGTFDVDASEPDTLLKLPANGTEIESPIMLFGTAEENRVLYGIELTLKNTDNNKFWNGVAWVNEPATFFKRVEQLRWHKNLDVPPGNYFASARALDKAGNYDPTPSTTEFRVK